MILDVAAQNASLANDYGPTHGPNSPDDWEIPLFAGDPGNGGVEISGPGYAAASLLMADIPAPVAGALSIPITFAAPTGAWADPDGNPPNYWGIRDPLTGYVWDYAPLTQPLNITGSGTAPFITVTIYAPQYQAL